MSGDTTHYCPECVRLALRLADAEIALLRFADKELRSADA